jgi:hypothetical protein
MEVTVKCDCALDDGSGHVGAACFHPRKGSVVISCGDQLFEIDALSGAHLWSAPYGRNLLGDVRLISFIDSKSGALNLVVAFQRGDIQVWDSETLQIRDHIAPSRKDESRPIACWACASIGGDPFAFISRTSGGIERVGLSSRRSSKSVKSDGKWKATSIAFSSQLIVAGSDTGDLRFLDPKTLNVLHLFSPSADNKSQHQALNSIFRTAIVSLSFCRMFPHILLSSFQKGGLVLWNLESSLLDDAVPTGPGGLVDAQFHPWFPIVLTVSARGEMTAWDIVVDLRKHAKLRKSTSFMACNFNRTMQGYYRRILPYVPPPNPAPCSKLYLHHTQNLCTVLTSRPEVNRGPGHGNYMLIYSFIDALHPYSLLPMASTCSCPVNLLQNDGVGSNVSDDLSEDLLYFVRSNKVACVSLSQPDVSPRSVASIPSMDSDGKLLRPLHLTRSLRYPLICIAMHASNYRTISHNAGIWKIMLIDVSGKGHEPVDCEADDEHEGRELFFVGIGAPAKPKASRLSAAHSTADRSVSRSKVEDGWSFVMAGRDALFAGDRLIVVSENGNSISLFQLPESSDPAHVTSWQVISKDQLYTLC